MCLYSHILPVCRYFARTSVMPLSKLPCEIRTLLSSKKRIGNARMKLIEKLSKRMQIELAVHPLTCAATKTFFGGNTSIDWDNADAKSWRLPERQHPAKRLASDLDTGDTTSGTTSFTLHRPWLVFSLVQFQSGVAAVSWPSGQGDGLEIHFPMGAQVQTLQIPTRLWRAQGLPPFLFHRPGGFVLVRIQDGDTNFAAPARPAPAPSTKQTRGR